MIYLALAALVLPLAASVVTLLNGKAMPRGGDLVPIIALVISAALSAIVFIEVFYLHPSPSYLASISFDWLTVGENTWHLGFRIDPLAAAVLMAVTLTSSLIHVFSTGYMHGDSRYSRFFAYISFFTAAMVTLILSDNLLFLFIGWELMGLCSYLLIGFWFEKEGPQKAAIKAFLTTRVGDAALFVGIATLYLTTGSLTFSGIFRAVEAGAVSETALLSASLLILAGAVGKSAQFPLHVWLPDAMEGPSPVSALIHAATMVAAGIYLVARMSPIFPPEALVAVVFIGSWTAFFAATLALTAMDFKKVLAFSTISQLGYMLTGIGVGGYVAGTSHLITHAFFKALLFLGSGAVLHAVHTKDMREMGGLARKMPITCAAMYAGALSLAGFPFLFSGFFSKDLILGEALAWGMEGGSWHYIPYILTAGAAGLTAFYTFRMMILVFHGEPKDRKRYDHAHEQPLNMTVPLVILAVLSTFLVVLLFGSRFSGLVEAPSLSSGGGAAVHSSHAAHLAAMVVSIVLGLGGIALAYAVYYLRWISPEVFVSLPGGRFLHRASVNLWWIDDLYLWIVRRVIDIARTIGTFDRAVIDRLVDMWGPVLVWGSKVSGLFDNRAVDGLANGISDAALGTGKRVVYLQTGRLQDYCLGLGTAIMGIAFLVLYIIVL